ncbi:hypothetical protein RHO12_06950 [Orbus sturtevantii]|uniref:anti-sigma B factor antagonist n=1 Tax=Orbus sturtevantii TaxID=3074109 RepID=UPI00370DD239
MLTSISVQKQASTLYLEGVLDCNSLAQIWSQHSQLLTDIHNIDVAQLNRVDSSGLALLTYLCIKYQTKLTGISLQLKTLIELYDLDPVILV